MKEVRFSPRAELDLEAVSDFIALDNPVRAGTFVAEIRARCASLADLPWQGRPAPILAPDARMLVFRDYLILYRVDDRVEIVRVIHGKRDLDAAIKT